MSKLRILFLDTYYPDFIKSIPDAEYKGAYNDVLKGILSKMFGTGDSYSFNISEFGFEAYDAIVNDERLQRLWHQDRQHNWDYVGPKSNAIDQVRWYQPDVLFLQDLSFLDPTTVQFIKDEYGVKLIAAQCSCPLPAPDHIKMCDVIFTSFPHYVEIFNNLGVRGVFSRLAFDNRLLEMVESKKSVRNNDLTFVGGVGYPSHWKAGLEMLETVASRVHEFKWWGYGVETLPDNYELKKKYQGQAWGLDMYRILAQSKIVLNRHGEVSRNYANNMKLFETTGMGALLLTDHKINMKEMFEVGSECATYNDADHAADLARFYLERPEQRGEIAVKGQVRTLIEHDYRKKMEGIANVLKEMLV